MCVIGNSWANVEIVYPSYDEWLNDTIKKICQHLEKSGSEHCLLVGFKPINLQELLIWHVIFTKGKIQL